MHIDELTTEISTLGKATLRSPVQKRADETECISFVSDESRIIIEVDQSRINQIVTVFGNKSLQAVANAENILNAVSVVQFKHNRANNIVYSRT